MILAQSANTPVQLVTSDPPASSASAPSEWMAYGLGAAGLLLIAVSFHLWMLRRAREATSELTFRRMALARGVPPRRRRLVRRLAELHNGADPIALLMSDHAMQRAAARFRTSGAPYPAGTSVKDLEKLLTNKAWPALAKE